ncbi:hypothetical protein D3C87_1957670 [compost metagenome]
MPIALIPKTVNIQAAKEKKAINRPKKKSEKGNMRVSILIAKITITLINKD